MRRGVHARPQTVQISLMSETAITTALIYVRLFSLAFPHLSILIVTISGPAVRLSPDIK